MTARRPLTRVDGKIKQLPEGDTLPLAALGLGTAATSDLRDLSFVNLMPDSGRFQGISSPLLTVNPAAYSNSSFFGSWNGSSYSSGGKYTYDNSTNGGAAAALNSRVQSLLAAMGRTGNAARYGVEFYVNILQAGIGTSTSSVSLDGTTRYLAATNLSKAMFIANGWNTTTMWIRCETGTFAFGHPGITDTLLWIDDVLYPMGTVITPAMGWIHVRVSRQSLQGYDNGYPYIYASVSAGIAIACPASFGGLVSAGRHTSPLASINSQSA